MKKLLSILFLSLVLVSTAATPALADGDEPPPCPPNAPNCRPPTPPVTAP